MKLALYFNSSDTNVMGKTLNYILELEGYLRKATDILNPIIDIEVSSEGNIEYDLEPVYEDNNEVEFTSDGENYEIGISLKSNILKCNYAYIEEFDRYYFINDIIINSSMDYSIYLNIDVLETYKNQVKELDAYVNRNQYTYNSMLQDDRLSYNYNKSIVYEDLSDKSVSHLPAFSIYTYLKKFDPFACIRDFNTACILTYNYKNGSQYYNTEEPFRDSTDFTWGSMDFESIEGAPAELYGRSEMTCQRMPIGDTDTKHFIRKITEQCLTNDTIKSFINHLMVYPFNVNYQDVYEEVNKIPIGKDKHITFDYKVKLTLPEYNTQTIFMDVIQMNSFMSYRDFSPYTKYEFYLPYYGWVELSGESINGKTLLFFYSVNLQDGTATANIYNWFEKVVIFTGKCQLGSKFPLDSSNATEIENQRIALASNTAIGIISSAITIGMGAVTNNPLAIAGGVMSGAKTISSAVNTANQLYEVGKVDVGTTADGINNSQKILFKKTEMNYSNIGTWDSYEKYVKYNGRPLYKVVKLSSLNGYTEIGSIRLEGINATNQELDLLDSILKNGFIIS